MGRNLFATSGRNLFADDVEPAVEPVKEPEGRSTGETVGDLWSSYAGGANSLLKIGGDIYGLATGDMENAASIAGTEGQKYWSDRKSDTLKQAEEDRKLKINASESTVGKAGTAFWETISSPTLMSSFIFEQVPMLLPVAGVGRVAGAGAKALGAGERVAGITATTGAVTAGGTMAGADAGSQAYDKLKTIPDTVWELNPELQKKVSEGMSYEDAKQEIALGLSQQSAVATGIVSGVTNFLPGARYLEKAVSGVRLPGASRVSNAVIGFLGEAGQEGIEEGFSALSSNIAASQVDNNIDIMEGVGEQAGMGAAAGPFGGAAGIMTPAGAPPKTPEDELAEEMNRIVDNSGFTTPIAEIARKKFDPGQDAALISETINNASTVEEALDIANQSIDQIIATPKSEMTTNELLNAQPQEALAIAQELPIEEIIAQPAEIVPTEVVPTEPTGRNLLAEEVIAPEPVIAEEAAIVPEEIVTPEPVVAEPVITEPIAEPAPVAEPVVEEVVKTEIGFTPMPEVIHSGPVTYKPKPIGGKLYRETSPEGIHDLLREALSNNVEKGAVSPIFVTDDADIALGQGKNKGVSVVLDGDLVSGGEVKKPGTGIEGLTGREYKTDFVGRDAIESFTLPKGMKLKSVARVFAKNQFNRTVNDDETVTYTRKDLPVLEVKAVEEAVVPEPAIKPEVVAEPVIKEPVQEATVFPPIIAQTKKKYLTGVAKKAGLKKGSPGYDNAFSALEAQYEADLDVAQANLTFEQFNELNPESPESVNRSAYKALREDLGIDQGRNLLEKPLADIRIAEDRETEAGDIVQVSRKADKIMTEIDGRIDDMKLLAECVRG